jgi:undecaprenyl-diphosphatase
MTFLEAVVLGIVEGLTEFLPVSSTGHMILVATALNVQDKEFADSFEIIIQLGAIMAVLAVYYKRFLVSLDIYLKLLIAFLPTAVVGLLAYKYIKAYLFNPVIVSVTLILGGLVLILLDRWSATSKTKYQEVEDIGYGNAAKIGLIQCLSMVPGMSRSATTIFGGILAGFDRKQAAEFSFLLAIPTMFAATGYDLYKTGAHFTGNQILLLLIGAVVSFAFALLAVKTFIAFITRYGFKHFGYYRIVLGILFLIIYFTVGFGDSFEL